MNYILLNADGSIKKTNFTDIITQNSNEENQIFVSVDGLDISENEAIGVFVLPDKSASVEAGTPEEDVEYSPGLTADGYIITLTSAETALAGLVYLTIQIKKSNTQKVLYTYRAPLTINETADLETYVNITLAQYNNLLDYINSALPDINNLVPYTGANKHLNLGNYDLTARDIKASDAVAIQNGVASLATFGSDKLVFIKNGIYTINYPTESGTFALTKQLPKQGLCATFNTSNFTQQSGGNYAISNIQVDDFISGSNVLVITWDNCFAICPIPQSGAGRVVAALWNASGESQIVRVRYELKSNNTLLDISLSGDFTPPSNHTGYVFCYKLFN